MERSQRHSRSHPLSLSGRRRASSARAGSRWAGVGQALRSAALPILLLGALAAALLDSEIGAGRWWRLDRDRAEAAARIEALGEKIRALDAERAGLTDDPYVLERAIREDLGLARPGEVLVQGPDDVSRSLARMR